MSAIRRSDGFTLIELVVCIVILGVLAAIAGARFVDHGPFNDRGYASELVAALRAARNTAVANNCPVQVTIDPVTGYQALLMAPVGNLCPAGAGAFTTAIRLTSGQLLANTPPAGVNADPQVVLVFGADGWVAAPPPPYNVGAFTVRVSASGYVQ
jgi:prepilin-type N-terminal cleavage/methylation domain-containing protein